MKKARIFVIPPINPRNFVEIGRVIYVRFGKNRDTLAVITDIIDHNWIFADGRAFPNGMKRGAVNIKDIALTHMKLKVLYFILKCKKSSSPH